MKLNVTVERPRNDEYFLPNEEVRGHVQLDVGISELGRLPKMHICFQGKIKLSFKSDASADTDLQFAELRLSRKSSLLFAESKTIRLNDCELSNTKSLGGVHLSTPFSFSFPHYAPRCGQAPKLPCSLPPSLDIRSAGLKAKVAYTVVVRIKRPGIIRRSLRAREEIPFRPPIPLPVQPSPSQGLLGPPEFIKSIAMLPRSRLGGPKNQMLLPGCLPPYSPSLTLEVVMAHPPLLVPGRTSLHILVCSSTSLIQSIGSVQLRSLTARLRSRTTIRNGVSARSHTSHRVLWRISGCLPIKHRKFEVDCGVWQDYSVPLVPPSFESCFLVQEYAVEVTVGITSQCQADVQYVEAAIDVVVADPPPGYSNSDLSSESFL